MVIKRHFDDELKRLKDKLFRMGLLVEQAIDNASNALFQRDTNLAHSIIKNDQEINLCEVEIDELGHELIALYQPAAVDLRFITVVLKMTSDLERMGDHAVNIAEKAMVMNQEPPVKPYHDLLPEMAQLARLMVRDSLNAFMENDAVKAKEILEKDDMIDQLNDQIYYEVQGVMQKQPDRIKTGVSLIMVAHNLERLADLATNIAEDVIYLKQGVDVRHHIRERRGLP